MKEYIPANTNIFKIFQKILKRNCEKHEKDIRKMFNYHSENLNEIISVNNVIQYKSDISKKLTRIKDYFLNILTNMFSQ